MINKLKIRMANVIRTILPKSVKQYLKSILGLPLKKMHQDWFILESVGPKDDALSLIHI